MAPSGWVDGLFEPLFRQQTGRNLRRKAREFDGCVVGFLAGSSARSTRRVTSVVDSVALRGMRVKNGGLCQTIEFRMESKRISDMVSLVEAGRLQLWQVLFRVARALLPQPQSTIDSLVSVLTPLDTS